MRTIIKVEIQTYQNSIHEQILIYGVREHVMSCCIEVLLCARMQGLL